MINFFNDFYSRPSLFSKCCITKRDYLHISDQCSIDTSSTMKKKRSEKIKYYPYHPKLVGTILQPTKMGQQENNSKKTTSKCTLL